MNATLTNVGDCTETFNVTLSGSQHGQSWPICTFTDGTLAPNSTVTLTTGLGFSMGSYALSVHVYNIYVSNTYTGVTVEVAPFALFRPWSWHRPIPI